jgi:HEAT repeat protein
MPLVRKPKTQPVSSKPEVADGLSALASTNPQERWSAARVAGDLAGGAEALAAALRTETDLRIREAMFTSLARIGTPESANLLLPLLRRDDAGIRTGALDALRMMPAAVRQILPKLLQDQDGDVRLLSCELARTLPGDEATDLLCGLLAAEREVNVCAAAIEVLAEVGNPAALPALAECERRFRDAPFLGFAIKIARERITAQSNSTRG